MQVKLKPCDGDCDDKPKVIWKREGRLLFCRNCWQKKSVKVEPTRSSFLPKSQKPIKKQSDKRKKEDILYTVMRKQWLSDHPMCFMAIPGICEKKATTIQHKKGRGKYYLDTRFWGSGCMPCHHYADTHPEEAFEKGWAIPRLTAEE